jgi:hypothetical protein
MLELVSADIELDRYRVVERIRNCHVAVCLSTDLDLTEVDVLDGDNPGFCDVGLDWDLNLVDGVSLDRNFCINLLHDIAHPLVVDVLRRQFDLKALGTPGCDIEHSESWLSSHAVCEVVLLLMGFR